MVRWVVGSILHGRYAPPASCSSRCSSVVRAFAHGAMGRQIDPPWTVRAISSSSMVRAFAHGAMGRRINPPWTVRATRVL